VESIPDKDNRLLYSDLAWIWPIISPLTEYIQETESFSKVIKKNSKKKVRTLLHLGCGGGHNDNIFKKHFKLTAVDISDKMLALASGLNPEVTYVQGDMRSIRLGGNFDAVAILDSINYMTSRADLQSVFTTAYEHLEPGGILLTFVEQMAGRFQQNFSKCSVHSKENIDIVFIENYYDPDPEDTTYEATFVYLIRNEGALTIHSDHHMCGLFGLETWLEVLNEVGFEVINTKFEHSTFTEEESYLTLLCKKSD